MLVTRNVLACALSKTYRPPVAFHACQLVLPKGRKSTTGLDKGGLAAIRQYCDFQLVSLCKAFTAALALRPKALDFYVWGRALAPEDAHWLRRCSCFVCKAASVNFGSWMGGSHLAVRQPREEDAHWSEGAHDFYVSIFGGVEHLRGRSMFASWKKSYCPIGADR